MSRYSFSPSPSLTVAYGFDTVCGYFLQVFDQSTDEPEFPIIDVDSMTHSRSDIAELWVEHGVEDHNEEHMNKIVIDLPL